VKRQNLFKKLLITILCISASLAGYTQQMIFGEGGPTFMNFGTGNNSAVLTKEGYKFIGSPFFPEEYCLAKVRTTTGTVYENLYAKLYLLDTLLFVQAPDKTDKVIKNQILTIEFLHCTDEITGAGTIFQTGFPAVDKQSSRTFYQVLDTGAAKLLKLLTVTYSDEKPFGTGGITRVFKIDESYYAFNKTRQMVKLNKNKEAVINALTDKKNEVSKFLTDKNLKCKKETDIITVFNYYNTL